MPLFTTYGKPKATIANYMKQIEQQYIPALNQRLGTNINNYPRIARETYAVYNDDESEASVEISSNHRDLDNRGDLFVAVSYNGMKEDAGIVNLNNIEDAVEISTIAFKELGFKTPEDIENDKQQDEIDRANVEKERKQQAAAAAKRKEELRREAERGDTEPEEIIEPEEEPDTYDEDKVDYEKDLKRSLKFLSTTPEGSMIELDWLHMPDTADNTKMSIVHIIMNLTHVSGGNFLVETQRINPKIQTITNIDGVMEYANKVSDKLRTTPQMNLKDEKGKPLQVPEDMTSEPDEDEDSFSVDI